MRKKERDVRMKETLKFADRFTYKTMLSNKAFISVLFLFQYIIYMYCVEYKYNKRFCVI